MPSSIMRTIFRRNELLRNGRDCVLRISSVDVIVRMCYLIGENLSEVNSETARIWRDKLYPTSSPASSAFTSNFIPSVKYRIPKSKPII
jgi:hypothetical protein